MNYWIVGTLILSLISPIFYSKSIFAHKAKPHKITRLIVWLASVAGVLAVTHSNNVAGKIFAAIFLARATYLLVLAAIYGVGGASKLDRGVTIFGNVPLTELIWYFSWALFGSVSYPFVTGARVAERP